jgi:hypothetical protein
MIFCWAVDKLTVVKTIFTVVKTDLFAEMLITLTVAKNGFYFCYVECELLNVITVNVNITSRSCKHCDKDSLAVLQFYPIKKPFKAFVIFTYCNQISLATK